MADSQDVLNSGITPSGWTNYDNPTSWGSKPSTPIEDLYHGGYHSDGGLIPVPNDPAAYRAAQQQSGLSSGRAQDVARYQSLGDAAMQQQAPQASYGGLTGADAFMRQGLGGLANARDDRQSQLGALALQQQAAMGNAPSQAQMLQRNTLDQGFQQQLAGAASARGGAMAQAAASRSAAQGAASYYQQGANSLGALRAQEMATARDAYMQGSNALQASDQAYANQAGQLGQVSAQQSQFNAQLQAQQNTLNNQAQQYYEGLGFNVNQASLNAAINQSSQLIQQNQFNQQMDAAQQQRTDQMIAAGIGAGATLGAGAITGGATAAAASAAAQRAKGGPLTVGQPTLVGEQGPEVVIPQGDGTVLPAHNALSQTVARKQMTLGDVAKLRQQADEIERSLHKQMASGPSVKRVAAGTPQNGYNTELTQGSDGGYQAWLARNAPRGDTGADYDYRGAYAAGMSRDVGAGEHFTDQFKKPNHETFSDESQYAAYGNPGHWIGDRFVAPPSLGAVAQRYAPNAVPYADAQPYLMGGRENPYGEDVASYSPAPTLASVQPQSGIVRDDPYAGAR